MVAACKSVGPTTSQPSAGLLGRALSDVTYSNRGIGYEWLRSWTGSWTGAPDNPSAMTLFNAVIRVICAASAHRVRGRTSCKRLVSATTIEAATEQLVTMVWLTGNEFAPEGERTRRLARRHCHAAERSVSHALTHSATADGVSDPAVNCAR
jgi:hypothetical protein